MLRVDYHQSVLTDPENWFCSRRERRAGWEDSSFCKAQ